MSLTSIRSSLGGTVAWVLIGLIAVAFSFFGTQGITSLFLGGSNFKVFGEDATTAFNFAMNTLQNQIDIDQYDEEQQAYIIAEAQQTAIKYAIEQSIFKKFTEELGVVSTEAEVLRSLARSTALQYADGSTSFTKAELINALSQRTGIPGGDALEFLTGQNAREKLISRLFESEYITRGEREYSALLNSEQRDLEMIVLRPRSFRLNIAEPSTEEIASFYESSQNSFLIPELLEGRFISFKPEDAVPTIEISEADVLANAQIEYEARLAATQQERSIRLIQLDPAAEDYDETLQAVETGLQQGVSFATLAQKHSTDVSAESGGAIGWVSAGFLPAAMEEVIDALPVGQASSIVEVDSFSYFLKVDEIQSQTPDLQALITEERELARKRATEQAIPDFLEQVTDLVYGSGDLDEIATLVKGETRDYATPPTSNFFSQLGIAQEIQQIIVDGDYEGKVFGPWSTTRDEQFVIEIKALKPAQAQAIEDVTPRITEILVDQRLRQAYEDASLLVEEQLLSTTDLTAIAKTANVEDAYRLASDISLNTTVLPSSLIEQAFSTNIANEEWFKYEDPDEEALYFVKVASRKIAKLSQQNIADAQNGAIAYYRSEIGKTTIKNQYYDKSIVDLPEEGLIPDQL